MKAMYAQPACSVKAGSGFVRKLAHFLQYYFPHRLLVSVKCNSDSEMQIDAFKIGLWDGIFNDRLSDQGLH